ncbi:MAG: FliM/FliN family flagellar motor switch protein [Planctomycetes bacterium]|nr:FliM/FliN family flagellar motor switch protein [Planctomycetota bacterium]
MGDILSADEIQALLASYSNDAEAADAPKAAAPAIATATAKARTSKRKETSAGTPPIDYGSATPAMFESPDALSRGKRAALENSLRRAADRVKFNLEAWFSGEIQASLGAFGLAKDYAPGDVESVIRFSLRIRGDADEGEAVIESSLAAALVRSKLRTANESVERPLTEVELAILDAEAATLVGSISEATEPLFGAPLVLGNRQREAYAGPRESALLWARFEFAWDGVSGRLWIGLPARALRARVEGSTSTKNVKLEGKDLTDRWIALLEPVRVPVAVVLGRTIVTVEELVRLEVGDVLLLDGSITDAVELASGPCAIQRGRLGQYRGKWTFRVERKSERTNVTGGKP